MFSYYENFLNFVKYFLNLTDMCTFKVLWLKWRFLLTSVLTGC